ncbi:MAG: hypothetical protein HY352_00085 [Candidatus Omnitrophica bacterium]|nr:hypothetical protein [Candidatus Omnitrophota bacterium]
MRGGQRARPIVIAHRGASAVAPESTRAAINAAIRAGAAMIELDVQMTRDGRLVVFHDDRLERTTNGAGRLRATTYARLARLDAGTWFDPRFSGERILLASHALRFIPPRVRINLEVKRTTRPKALVRTIRALLRRTRHSSRILLSSFDATLLRLLRRAGWPCAVICRRQADRALACAIRLGCESWHPFHALATPRRVARAHAAGLRVHAWTVDDRRTVRRLLRMGVDGIFTNDPAKVSRMIA